MDKEVFKASLEHAASQDCDAEGIHQDMDAILVTALIEEGYDLSVFENETKWYA